MLVSNGFDDMETLLEIDDPDLKDLGVPRGHALKLKKRLREYQLAQCSEPPSASDTPSSQQRASQACQAPQRLQRMLTAEMKSAVERSWDQVQALGTAKVAEMVLRNLFRLSPATVQLFPTHVRAKYTDWTVDEAAFQGAVEESPALRRLFSKLVNAVGCAVAGLHDVRKLVPMLLALGERHATYGVSEAHWKILGEALQLTLEDALREAYTQEVASAWSTVYGFISSIMMEGFRSAMTLKGSGFAHKPSGFSDDAISTSQGSTVARSESL